MAKEISGLKREIKRAKLFEVQRLVRRMRQLANKKGTEAQLKKNQRKIERFEKELECLKDTEVAQIVRRVTNNKSEDGNCVDHVFEDHVEDAHTDIDLQRRAIDRIVNSAKLQKFLERVSASEKESAQSEIRSSDSETLRLKKKLKTPKEKAAAANGKSVFGNPQRKEDDDNESSDAEAPRIRKQQKATKQKATTSKHVASKKPQLKETDQGDTFISGSDFSDSDVDEDTDDISSPELKPKGLESCFVQSMSGLKDERKVHVKAKSNLVNKKTKAANKMAKKNRRGQRARQQLWEKVHGRNAKHLMKKTKEYSSKENKEVKKLKQNKVKTQQCSKQTHNEEILHPSWEATKRRRLQETMKVEFKGEKIRFDDSE